MKLKALLGPEVAAPAGSEETEVTGLTADSRAVRAGWLFAALAGSNTDGARYLPEALAKGASAVLVGSTATPGVPLAVPVLTAAEPRRALALMAARFYGSQPALILGVTGTSGKTSVADFTRQLLALAGRRAASLGTLGVITPRGASYGALTTPDPVHLHRTLAELAREEITHVALEASSHGLHQHRLDGVRFSAAGFTNLGRDHLDYHPTPEAYFAAKLRLFTELLAPGGIAVINADGAHARQVIAAAKGAGRTVMTVGAAGEELTLCAARPEGFTQHIEVAHGRERVSASLALLGAYQVGNALLAAGLAVAAGERADAVLAQLGRLQGVKGRLEVVARLRGGLIVVDYAHKPDALAAALDALRQAVPGKIVCVLGCGGDRDRGKRPIMGRIAATKANHVIVTDDNPRSERPEAIRAEILRGAPGAREIGDRGEAIRAGARLLGGGDALLIAGKGHETGQIVGARVLPFSDHEAVGAALAEPPIDV